MLRTIQTAASLFGCREAAASAEPRAGRSRTGRPAEPSRSPNDEALREKPHRTSRAGWLSGLTIPIAVPAWVEYGLPRRNCWQPRCRADLGSARQMRCGPLRARIGLVSLLRPSNWVTQISKELRSFHADAHDRSATDSASEPAATTTS